MIVASGTSNGQTQQTSRDRIDSIFPFVRHHFGTVAAIVLRSQSEESERKMRFGIFRIDQVRGQLQANEFVVRHVAGQSVDHPVAIKIGVGISQRIVVADLVRLVFGVTGDIEPETCPTLRVLRVIRATDRPTVFLRPGVDLPKMR